LFIFKDHLKKKNLRLSSMRKTTLFSSRRTGEGSGRFF
jgi:hypothetical protein